MVLIVQIAANRLIVFARRRPYVSPWLLGIKRVSPNRHFDQLTFFAGLTRVSTGQTDRQTDRQTITLRQDIPTKMLKLHCFDLLWICRTT